MWAQNVIWLADKIRARTFAKSWDEFLAVKCAVVQLAVSTILPSAHWPQISQWTFLGCALQWLSITGESVFSTVGLINNHRRRLSSMWRKANGRCELWGKCAFWSRDEDDAKNNNKISGTAIFGRLFPFPSYLSSTQLSSVRNVWGASLLKGTWGFWGVPSGI